MCVCVCVCVCFQQTFSHNTTVAACCMRRVLSATNTDWPCRRHKTHVHHPVTLFWHRADPSWFLSLNAERLARKQPVPILKTHLLWRGWVSKQRPSEYEANVPSTRSPSQSVKNRVYKQSVALTPMKNTFQDLVLSSVPVGSVYLLNSVVSLLLASFSICTFE